MKEFVAPEMEVQKFVVEDIMNGSGLGNELPLDPESLALNG